VESDRKAVDLHQRLRADQGVANANAPGMEDALRCRWWWSNDGIATPGYAMIFGPITMLAFVVLTLVVVAWVLKAAGLGWHVPDQGKSALDILKDRFARGEIDRDEYEERKKLLSSR
jgi:putative membrane protein